MVRGLMYIAFHMVTSEYMSCRQIDAILSDKLVFELALLLRLISHFKRLNIIQSQHSYQNEV